ncbi:MAG TPA: polyprenyl synthetase family protein [Thermoanaerobaculia bacterium]
MGSSTAAPEKPPTVGSGPSFSSLQGRFLERIEPALAAWLAQKRAQTATDGPPDLLEPHDVVADLVAHGGKRLRPALVHFAYLACGGTDEAQALPLALSTELLHTFLLIHDDIMDHADVRRGKPAAHARFAAAHRARGLRGDAADFGASVAILAGDLAHTYAVELFTGLLATAATAATADGSGARWPDLHRTFAVMCQEVIGGQYLEMLLAQRRGPARESELMEVLRRKSGRYTAERPVELGAILAGAPAAVRAELGRYGAAVGEAFQLQDDLLGMFGDAAAIGKPVGGDLREGKVTFLIHHARESATESDRDRLDAALGNPALNASEVAAVQAILERTGARRRVTEMVSARLAAAGEALAAADVAFPLAGEGHDFLAGLIDELAGRER